MPVTSSVIIGCTFTPEKYPDQSTSLDGLRFVLDNMGIRKIRLAIRWNQVWHKNGSLSLNYYKPFFEIFDRYSNLELCLNLGPIKTTAWPEIHVPPTILNKYPNLPSWPSELPNNHQLVLEAGEYLHNLCKLLQRELSRQNTKSMSTVQLNNEGYNPFGDYLLVSSIDTEIYFQSIAAAYFPKCSILFNSAGKLQARKILRTQAKLASKSILGIDYYYHTPINDYPLIRHFNQLNLPLPWLPSMKNIINTLEQTGNTLEITELQMESWGHITYPGESVEALKKNINLLAKYKPAHQENLLIRLWGVEPFAHAFLTGSQTSGMEEMLEFISKFN